MTTAAKLFTAEDLLDMPGSKYLELYEGELTEVSPANARHGDVAGQIAMVLRQYVKPRNLGAVLVEGGFILHRHPDTVLGPDVSFIEQSRIPEGGLPEKFFEGHPDLAIEIVSPRNPRKEQQIKIQRYLAAGTRLCWLVDPGSKSVDIFRPPTGPRPTQKLSGQETISGEGVIPGFSAPIAEFFA